MISLVGMRPKDFTIFLHKEALEQTHSKRIFFKIDTVQPFKYPQQTI